jgi:hypothetical protein
MSVNHSVVLSGQFDHFCKKPFCTGNDETGRKMGANSIIFATIPFLKKRPSFGERVASGLA